MKFIQTQKSALVVYISALSFLLMLGCASNKASVQPEVKLQEGKYLGTVTNQFSQKGCNWLVKYNDGGEHKYLIPVQLEGRYKKNGLKIEFGFYLSRIKQGNCQMGQPAVLENIEPR